MAQRKKVKLDDVRSVISRLYVKRGETAEGMARGQVKAALKLQELSQAVVPVDTGNLKNTAFTRVEGEGFSTVATVGYTASYAPFVHEIPANHAPGKIDHYLSVPALENKELLVEIIRKEAQLKGKKGRR